MSIKINYKNNIKKNKIKNFVLFVDENFNIIRLKKSPIDERCRIKSIKLLKNNQIKR